MSDASALWTTVDDYFASCYVGADSALQLALSASHTAGLPDISVSPTQGKFLNLLVRMNRSARVLEIGTLGGYSTIWMARALPAGGKVVTLEINAKHAAVARANFLAAGVADVIELRDGAALDLLDAMLQPAPPAQREPAFDFVFIDADKANIPGYFQRTLQLTHPGSVIVVDNVVRSGAVIDTHSKDASVIGVRAFNDLVAAEPRVSATGLQTVGVKGYDGLAILLVQQTEARA